MRRAQTRPRIPPATAKPRAATIEPTTLLRTTILRATIRPAIPLSRRRTLPPTTT
jgi:hypothetical protein